ncbi:Fic family protein [Leucobacter exalbidus]|uniref:Fic family protein n=1 Tax=Leucobacter exalbidus TaxID=662960 RepID=A0A940PRZ0_9MICO|nr:Fic family protein [Leucobacter exalbidus]MBP1325145.1 Fic family protein [Leucobacter exalbidus]
MAHLNFVLIHPFKDGNGRMARIIQSLTLAKASDSAPIFMGIEEFLGRRTQAYYDVLAQVGQGNWATADRNSEAARPWVRFILTAHFNQASELKHRITSAGKAAVKMEELAAAAVLPERAVEVLSAALFGGTTTRSRYLAALEEIGEVISEQMASRDLTALVKAGLLASHSDKRGDGTHRAKWCKKRHARLVSVGRGATLIRSRISVVGQLVVKRGSMSCESS